MKNFIFCAVCYLKEVSKVKQFVYLKFERTLRNLPKTLSECFDKTLSRHLTKSLFFVKFQGSSLKNTSSEKMYSLADVFKRVDLQKISKHLLYSIKLVVFEIYLFGR